MGIIDERRYLQELFCPICKLATTLFTREERDPRLVDEEQYDTYYWNCGRCQRLIEIHV